MGKNCVYKGQKMILFYIRNSYILRPKLPKTPIFLAKTILYSSYILGKTWLTACINLSQCKALKMMKTQELQGASPPVTPHQGAALDPQGGIMRPP